MTELPENGVVKDIKIESIVFEADVIEEVPIVKAGTMERVPNKFSDRPVPSPWEFVLRRVPGEFYSGDWKTYHCCPRCLGCYPLPHGVTIEGCGEKLSAPLDKDADQADAEYIYADYETVENIVDCDDISLTVDPSIGCPTCGLHTLLKNNEYTSIMGDWNESSGNGERTYEKRMMYLEEFRGEVYQKLIDIGYPDPL